MKLLSLVTAVLRSNIEYDVHLSAKLKKYQILDIMNGESLKF